MKFVILFGLLILGALFVYPLANEDVDSPCTAVERQVLRLLMTSQEDGAALLSLIFGNFYRDLSMQGEFARVIAKSRYPDVPVFIGCSIIYYEARLNQAGLFDE